jgi:cytochrome c553
MSKLVLFLSGLVLLTIVVSMNSFKELTPQNKPFQLQEAKKIFEQKHALLLKEAQQNTHQAEASLAEVVEEVANKLIEIPLDTPELQNGHKIYRSSGKCTTCHGQNGEGRKSQQAPKLAAQYDWYLHSQLVNMKEGVRVNKIMGPYLKNLSDQDMKDVALFLSKLPAP